MRRGIFFTVFLVISNLAFTQSCQFGGCFNGFGVYEYANNDVYRGDWLNGKRTGDGSYYYTNGTLYKGGFLEGKYNGVGTILFNNGDVKVAEYSNGVEVILVSYTYANQKKGGCVSGNCQNGFGKYIYTNGIYEGNFINGLWVGKGKYIAPNGDTYDGEFVNSKRNGYGVFVWANGKKYEGNWIDGKVEGKGTYYYLDGSSYTGDLVDYTRSGFGTYNYLDGSFYTGNWSEGQKNGHGRLEYPDGKVEEGLFENGKFLGIPTQNQTIAATNQKPINQVQTSNESCTYKFTKPVLSITWVDNRHNCCNPKCTKLSRYYDVSKDNQEAAERQYLNDALEAHFIEMKATPEHKAQDRMRLGEFISNTYYPNQPDVGFDMNKVMAMLSAAGSTMQAGFTPDLSALSNETEAQKIQRLKSKSRKVNKYKVEKYCSESCEEYCKYLDCGCRF